MTLPAESSNTSSSATNFPPHERMAQVYSAPSEHTSTASSQPLLAMASQSSNPTRTPIRLQNQSVNLSTPYLFTPQTAIGLISLAIAITLMGWFTSLTWLGLGGAIVTLLIALRILWNSLKGVLDELLSPEQRLLTMALLGVVIAILSILEFTGINQGIQIWLSQLNWEAVGAGGEVIGAVGQILIAVLAVYVAWRQYVISKDLTIQQNLITQQQTIDSYFQGISELVLDADGLLEDWPQERAIAEGRTAAILSSVDGEGKAKVLRFLSRSKLLTPLKRDLHLGRAILDGQGGYAEDREYGIRVIDLGIMLAKAKMSGSDLRWTDLSDANLIGADLSRCELVRANLTRTILCDANLTRADLKGARFFYGKDAKTASPRSRADIPNYKTGEFTGAVIEGADFTEVEHLSKEQHWYCCAWGGSKTRATIPGGCEAIPNRLER